MQQLKTCAKCNGFVWIEQGMQDCNYCLGSNDQTRQYKREIAKAQNEAKKRHDRILLSLNKLVIFVLFICLVLSSCDKPASGKYVVKLAKTVEVNSKNHDDLVNALDANNILPKQAIDPLKANSKKTYEYAKDLAKEDPSFWADILSNVLDGFILVSNVAGGYFGLSSGTAEKGIALITMLAGLFGSHTYVMNKRNKESKRKVKIAEKLDPAISKAYREAELKTLEEEKKA